MIGVTQTTLKQHNLILKQDKRVKATDTTPMTSDDTEQSDRGNDKLLRNKSSLGLSAKFGKYFGKLGKGGKDRMECQAQEARKGGEAKKDEFRDSVLRKSLMKNVAVKKEEVTSKKKASDLRKNDARKAKSYSKKRIDSDRNGSQDKMQTVKETKTVEAHGKSRLKLLQVDSDFNTKEEEFKQDSRDKRDFINGGTSNRSRKNPSVTFSPTVTCASDKKRVESPQKTKNLTSKRLLTSSHKQTGRLVAATDTSDTDSTTQELPMV